MVQISDECRAFLNEQPRTGKLATVREDGRPHIAPIWFIVDGDTLLFNTGKTTVKGKNLLRDGHVSLCVDDEQPPYAFATIEGTVVVSEDPQELLHTATIIAARYLGEDKAEEFGKRNGVPGELVVCITPTHVVFVKNLAS